MKTDNKKNICIRTDLELFEKFRYVSQYHYRSPNRQIVHLMKLFVAGHEQAHGEIDLSSLSG